MLQLWARVWSPVVPFDETGSAWKRLGLPGDPVALHADFVGAFHHGAPLPLVPLLLHHALKVPGDAAREDWMRALYWLGLQCGEMRLPPDHLAVACEIVAVAQSRRENVLVDELIGRYMLSWCSIARKRLNAAGSPVASIAECFAQDLDACLPISLHRTEAR